MSNVRNSRTTHPRKTARRGRSAARFSIDPAKRDNVGYMGRKTVEAKALGIKL